MVMMLAIWLELEINPVEFLLKSLSQLFQWHFD